MPQRSKNLIRTLQGEQNRVLQRETQEIKRQEKLAIVELNRNFKFKREKKEEPQL